MAIAVASNASANMLIDVQNPNGVQWTPNKLDKALPARVGTTLEAGDRLTVGQGATATVLCLDGTIWKLGGGQSAQLEEGCQNVAATNLRQVFVSNQDAVNLEGYPYPMTPRFTLVQPKDFTIAWNAVAGAKNYKVQIGELFGSVWETETSATSIRFDNSVTLEPEVDYLVVVESDNGLSSTAASPPFGFRVATAEQLQAVETKLTAVRNAGLKGDSLAIAEAGVYASSQFLSDALNVLEQVMDQGSKNPAVYAYAGKLYRFTGLSREAAAKYEQAIALADSQDIELVTTASANLAQLKTMINRQDAAVFQAKAAMGYNELGETENTTLLNDSLAIAANTSNSSSVMRSGAGGAFQAIITPQAGTFPGTETAIAATESNSRIRVRGGLPSGEVQQLFDAPPGESTFLDDVPGGEAGFFDVPGGEAGFLDAPGGE